MPSWPRDEAVAASGPARAPRAGSSAPNHSVVGFGCLYDAAYNLSLSEAPFPNRRIREYDFTDPRLAPFEKRFRRLDALASEARVYIDAFVVSARRDEQSGLSSASEESRRLLAAARAVNRQFSELLDDVQRASGFPDELFEAIEAAEMPTYEDRYWRKDVLGVQPTGDLDSSAAAGLEALTALVDPAWLADQAQRGHRLSDDFQTLPLHLVGSVRLNPSAQRPQRFAQMLLVARDHLNKVNTLDFFGTPTFVAEVAALGTRLDAIRDLGPEATTKLRRLPSLTDDEVSSTIYELLVGTAGVIKGLSLEMLPTDGVAKTPDLTDSTALAFQPASSARGDSICPDMSLGKRNTYRRWTDAIGPALAETHSSVEASFTAEPLSLTAREFSAFVTPLLFRGSERRVSEAPWGTVAIETLPYTLDIPWTRTYAPNFLSAVFGWHPDDGEWDGLSCQVDPMPSIMVRRVKNPRCLKWVTRSATATLKKSRSITSLWGRAIQQLPTGELGFVYIAYPEGHRGEVADARTREILEACQRWKHRWSISVGATVVNRLYPRTLSVGMPDLIESTIPIVAEGDEHFLRMLPNCVFVPPPVRGEAR